LKNVKEITLTLIPCDIYGYTTYQLIKNKITNTTCLVLIPYINYDTGAINNIPLIGDSIKTNNSKVSLMCNAINYVNNYDINAASSNSDIITFCYNSISIALISNELMGKFNKNFIFIDKKNRYDFICCQHIERAIINLKKDMSTKMGKNKYIKNLKNIFIEELKKYPTIYVEDINIHMKSDISKQKGTKIIILSPPIEDTFICLPNILLMSIINLKGKDYSNVYIHNQLKKKGYIISYLERDSILIECLNYSTDIKLGCIKITFNNELTKDNVINLVKELKSILLNQLNDN